MIIILSERLVPGTNQARHWFRLTPESDLLGKLYIDRLAERYRSLGADDVLLVTHGGAQPRDGADAAWGPLSRISTHEEAIKRGELVLIADMRLWPDAGLCQVLEDSRHAISDLSSFVLSSDRDDYLEVIDPVGGTVMRRYEDKWTREAASFPAAIMVRPKALGPEWQELLGAVSEGDAGRLEAAITNRHYQLVESPWWVGSADAYVALLHELLSAGGPLDPAAEKLAKGVWAMPGANVDPNSEIEGPVFLGSNCRVGRGARIIGPAFIGDSAAIGEDCFVGKGVVLKGAVLRRYARVWRSVIGAGKTLKERQSCAFLWLDDEDRWHRLSTRDRRPFRMVVLRHWRPIWRHQVFSVCKRGMDICGSLFGLGVTVPLYPFIALAIKLDSPGPVFYVHRRQTLRGREFGCLKFRSMVKDSHKLQLRLPNEVDGPQFHIENDPRLTSVGKFLRRTNLDEVPQFWNVLLGHMSLVGPRPSPDRENQYCPAWREARLSVRPGLTGMWQISRSNDRSQGDFHEWIRYDTQYVRECSLRTDVELILSTVRHLARRSRKDSIATRGHSRE